ncbi:hypothetical protein ANCDUO_23068, partial [Ancylostoma duodenale]
SIFQGKDEGTRKKKESIVDLSRFIDKKIRVKFQGGREVLFIPPRSLGLIVARGTAITVVAPSDGMEQIDNPFAQQEE